MTLEQALEKAERVFDEQIQVLVADALQRLEGVGATPDEVCAERARIDQDIVQARRAMIECVTTAFYTAGESTARFQ